MPDTANIEAVRGFLEAIYSGDLDRAFESYATPGFFWVVSTVDNDELRAAIPWAGRRLEGKGGFVRPSPTQVTRSSSRAASFSATVGQAALR